MPNIIKEISIPNKTKINIDVTKLKKANGEPMKITIDAKAEKTEEINLESTAEQPKYATVTIQNGVLNIRSGMGTNTEIVATVENGSKLEILEDAGDEWIKVKLSDETIGYAFKEFVTIDESVTQKETTQDVASKKNITKTRPSEFAISPHTKITSEERNRRIQMLGGECGSKAEQDSKMQQITVPIWDGTQHTTMQLTVNKNLVTEFENVFKELDNIEYKVFKEYTGAYDYYHPTRPSGAPSDHTLGGTIDLNSAFNWYSGDGSSYAIRNSEEVIKIFADQGFYWGGDWSNPDDMHFSWTGW